MDICMCDNEECKLKEDCLRFTSRTGELLEVYATFECKDKKSEDSYFIDNKK